MVLCNGWVVILILFCGVVKKNFIFFRLRGNWMLRFDKCFLMICCVGGEICVKSGIELGVRIWFCCGIVVFILLFWMLFFDGLIFVFVNKLFLLNLLFGIFWSFFDVFSCCLYCCRFDFFDWERFLLFCLFLNFSDFECVIFLWFVVLNFGINEFWNWFLFIIVFGFKFFFCWYWSFVFFFIMWWLLLRVCCLS